MIRVTEEYLKEKDDKIKFYMGLSLAVGFILIMALFSIMLIQYRAPFFFCQKWGGVLYEDNNCYPISDMDKCIDMDGYLMDKSRAFTLNLVFNVSETNISILNQSVTERLENATE